MSCVKPTGRLKSWSILASGKRARSFRKGTGSVVCAASGKEGPSSSTEGSASSPSANGDAKIPEKKPVPKRRPKTQATPVGPFKAVSDLITLVIKSLLYYVVPAFVTLFAGLLATVFALAFGERIVERVRPMAAQRLPTVRRGHGISVCVSAIVNL
eukprot:9498933-Pyramimonas_sp.AAC.1